MNRKQENTNLLIKQLKEHEEQLMKENSELLSKVHNPDYAG